MAGTRYPEIYQNGETTLVRVDMGEPELSREAIPVKGEGSNTGIQISAAGQDFSGTAVSMGNPHCIIYVDDIKAVPLEQWGPPIETHELFPEKTNVEFIQVKNPREIDAIVWERGSRDYPGLRHRGLCHPGRICFKTGKRNGKRWCVFRAGNSTLSGMKPIITYI